MVNGCFRRPTEITFTCCKRVWNFSISTISKSMLDPFNSTELQLNILMFSSSCHLSAHRTHIFCVFVAELHFRSMLYAKSLKAATILASVNIACAWPFPYSDACCCWCFCCLAFDGDVVASYFELSEPKFLLLSCLPSTRSIYRLLCAFWAFWACTISMAALDITTCRRYFRF